MEDTKEVTIVNYINEMLDNIACLLIYILDYHTS
jgi:hypothetical protein